MAFALAASVVLWSAACTMPALYLSLHDGKAPSPQSGLWCALIGPLGIFYGCGAWYGNVATFIAAVLLTLRRYVGAAIATVMALLLALSVFRLFWVDIDMDEGGVLHGRMTSLGPAVPLWLLSLLLPGAIALWLRAKERGPYRAL